MTVESAVFTRPQAGEESVPFVPTGPYRGQLDELDYVEEEWFAAGEADGHPYATSVFVRRRGTPPVSAARSWWSRTHAASATPIWIYTSLYLMRAGHGWAAVCSQKSALDAFVKPFDPDRCASLQIWSDAPPMEGTGLGALAVPRDPAAMQARMEQMRQVNQMSTPILAQVGAALARGAARSRASASATCCSPAIHRPAAS